MAQNWTKELPKDGYYWARREGCAPEVVEIEGGKVKSRTIYNEPLTVPLNKTIYRAAMWFGPIAPPEPVKEKRAK